MKLGAIHSVIAAAIATLAAQVPQMPAVSATRRSIERKAARQLSRAASAARIIWDSTEKGTYVSPEGKKRMAARRAAYKAAASNC